MINLGKVQPGTTIYIPFETFAGSTGAPITITGLATSDILVYKDGSTTQRASASGFTLLDTDGIDFDGITGIHGFSIDLSDNTTADFWASGSKYFVVVSTVTVDSQTMSFIAATFQIGEVGSILDTTIATLSSQTSFTLTSGPAEDSALVGRQVIIHDAASAVQQAFGIISAYTGSTKTVTLAVAPTFTIAAKDNISVMLAMPLQPTTPGNTLDVASGGEAGIDWGNVANKTTSNALTGTTIATTQQVDVNTIKTQAVTCAAGVTVGAFVGNATAAISVDASGKLLLQATQSGVTIPTVTTVTNQLTAAQIATGVWQDTTAGDFTTASSIGKSLYTSGVVPGASGGLFIAGTNAATTVTTSFTTTFTGNLTGSVGSVTGAVGSVTGNVGGNVTGSVGSVVGAVGSVTGNVGGNVTGSVGSVATGGISAASFAAGAIDAAAIAANAIGASELAADAVAEIQAGLSTLDAAGVRSAIGMATANLDTQLDALPTAAENATAVLTTQMTESYNTDGTAPTLAQAVFVTMQGVTEFAISGTTKTVKKIDGSTTAYTETLDSSTAPTSITRTT